MNKNVTFTDAKVGDRVWSLTEGWGTIIDRFSLYIYYPVAVEFDNGAYRTYTLLGRLYISDHRPTLFWNEVKFDTPEKPLPQLEVDAKVLVWNNPNQKHRRHFSHFSNGRIYTFDSGSTSFTRLHAGSITCWTHWELAE